MTCIHTITNKNKKCTHTRMYVLDTVFTSQCVLSGGGLCELRLLNKDDG